MHDITIVTAFFDIGRGNWNSGNFKRTSDDYLNYFKWLATLENKMVIFTSAEYVDKVKQIRGSLPTKIITLDFNKKFKYTIKRIDQILKTPEYQALVPKEIRKNPEYQSAEYVLVNNLKYYFVISAIRDSSPNNQNLFAWVDFGFCRKKSTTNGIKLWRHSFDQEHIHLFTLKEKIILEDKDKMLRRALSNEVFVIGSMIVGSKEAWQQLYTLISEVQTKYLNQGISDDDQGTMIMTVCERPDLFKIHSLYKRGWFSSFKIFNKGSTYINFWAKLKASLDKLYTKIKRR